MDKIKPSDLKQQAQQLIASGQMPELDEVLGAVSDSREKYAKKIKAAQKEK